MKLNGLRTESLPDSWPPDYPMEIYRIVREEYSDTLFASGRANRWNLKGEEVIYTAASRSLACLENVVHSSGESLFDKFVIMVIHFPDELAISTLIRSQLPDDWFARAKHPFCQQLGSQWYKSQETPALQVPSAIVHQERNFVLNARHEQYGEIKVIDRRPFAFDPRIKEDQYD